MKAMVKHRSHSIDFKRQVAQECLSGETLLGLAMHHDLSRNLVRVWVQKYEAGAFDEDAAAADMIQEYEAPTAATVWAGSRNPWCASWPHRLAIRAKRWGRPFRGAVAIDRVRLLLFYRPKRRKRQFKDVRQRVAEGNRRQELPQRHDMDEFRSAELRLDGDLLALR